MDSSLNPLYLGLSVPNCFHCGLGIWFDDNFITLHSLGCIIDTPHKERSALNLDF